MGGCQRVTVNLVESEWPMAQKIIRVCDTCGAEGAVPFKIQEGAKKSSVDLCDTHAEPVRALLRAAGVSAGTGTPKRSAGTSQARSRARKAPSSGQGIAVTSMEEVKAQVRDPFQTPH